MSERSSALLSLYEALFSKVKSDFSEDNSMTVKELYKVVTASKEFLVLKQQAKEDEIALVEQFLKRDIANYLQEKNATDLSHSPSVIVAENTLWHWLSEITDRSQMEWHEVSQDFKHNGYYQSGEIVGQGVMVCTECGHEMRIEFPGVIPDCPKCDCGQFTREALAP
ncbi:zinc ribbon-containing protein [Shewanella psychrotolerans]|uniref:zinc ribbon-containing protein n=1 Tax=Shewanella psychrotolerans TaxID=2864206 RepID=UPI001C65F917|nr:zinc ribbon-containing protein [Shewanella psychrotolerans]QYK02312.1 zinc ribbon-containing protein [Shewanella psychrotolerans]